ncbi:MAG: DUF2249 domain-containing protein [Symbiobacteriia bacterium]
MAETSRTLELDVRDYHKRGEEPFPAIMKAATGLEPGDIFILINSFEPHPLYRVLSLKGFTHTCEELGPEHYRITFTKGAGGS